VKVRGEVSFSSQAVALTPARTPRCCSTIMRVAESRILLPHRRRPASFA
jgi:hypothetical protein